MTAGPLDLVVLGLGLALLAVRAVLRLVLRRRRTAPTGRVAGVTGFRWPWTGLLVVAVVAIVLDHGRFAATWLIAILAALQTLLTWTLHVVVQRSRGDEADQAD